MVRRARDVVARSFTSPLHDERTAGILGLALGACFAICFGTGLISHLLQHPQSWFHWPARPVDLYRVTQGLHVLTGIATIPLLLAKLWTVYPKLFSWPPVKDVPHLLERLSLLPLIGGALFLLFTGVANIAYWYAPMPFSFPAAHYWVAWLTVGALLVHIGAKLAVTREAVFGRGLGDAIVPTSNGLSRRGFLATVSAASAVLVITVAGETVRALNPLALLAPRRPDVGPQRLPVNRSAASAGVRRSALDLGYRLVVDGAGVQQPLSLSRANLQSMPQRSAGLPITCVEGWSASARWAGVPLGDVLALVGVPAASRVRIDSLEVNGLYRSSVIEPDHAADRDTLLALELNGAELDLDHGYPVRLIAPNRPGVLQTKWVSRVTVL